MHGEGAAACWLYGAADYQNVWEGRGGQVE